MVSEVNSCVNLIYIAIRSELLVIGLDLVEKMFQQARGYCVESVFDLGLCFRLFGFGVIRFVQSCIFWQRHRKPFWVG